MKKPSGRFASRFSPPEAGLSCFVIDIGTKEYWFIMPDGEAVPGYQSTSGDGYSYEEIIHSADLPLVEQRIKEVSAGKAFIPFTFRERNDGTDPFYVTGIEQVEHNCFLITMFPVVQTSAKGYADNGTPISWRSPFFDLIDESAVLLTVDGKVSKVNRAFMKEFGWEEEDLVGRRLPFIPAELSREFEVGRARLLAGERVFKLDTVRLREDGSRVPVHLQAFPIFDEEGQICALSALIISRESTLAVRSLIQLQERIIQTRDQLIVDIMDNVDLGICQYDCVRRKYMYLNPAIETLFGVSLNELYADPPAISRNFLDPELRQNTETFFKGEKLKEGEVEYKISASDDQIRWIRSKFIPIVDESGRTVRKIIISQDITDLKHSQELSRKWEQLGVVGRLAAGIAHEVRNPLTTVKGFVQLSGEQDSPFTEVILDELQRIELIMDEFLVLAKPNQETEMKRQSLDGILREVTGFLEAEAHLHGCRVILSEPKEPVIVNCEAKQIKQVMINLVKNAVEAMPEGGDVRVGLMRHDDKVEILVEDDGIGIPEDRLHRLGEPFYSNKEKGTGLGLMTSYKIIEHHGGNIRFESVEGRGTTVRVELPAQNITGRF